MPITDRTLRLEAELEQDLLRVTNAQTRDLVAAWALAWDEVAPDLRDALAEQLIAGDRITRAQLMRSTRLRGALQVIADELERLAGVSQVRITRDMQAIVATAGAAQASIVDSQLPPGFMSPEALASWSRVDAGQIEAIVRRTTEQITARHKPLSAEAHENVRRELIRGVAAGSNPRETAARMVVRSERGFNGGLTRALVISRTETLDAYRAAAQLGQDQHTDVLGEWMWLAELGARTCRSCLAMHGTTWPLETPGPLDHQQGRCARVPKTKSWADLGFGDVEEPADVTPDADDFFANLPEADQIQILGRRGYAEWKAGRWPRSQWSQRRTTDGWRDSYAPATPPSSRGRRRPVAA